MLRKRAITLRWSNAFSRSRSSGSARAASIFVVWGIVGAFITVIAELADQHRVGTAALWSIPVVIVAGAVFSIVRARQTRRVLQRSSIVQREFFNVLWLTLGLAFVADVAVFRIFAGIAGAAIWSVAQAIVLLYIGMHGNRRAQIAGILVVASLIAANFSPPNVAGTCLPPGCSPDIRDSASANCSLRE